MTPSELLHIRLYNQLLSMHALTEPREVVAWMGAMQSQALEMAKWLSGRAWSKARQKRLPPPSTGAR